MASAAKMLPSTNQKQQQCRYKMDTRSQKHTRCKSSSLKIIISPAIYYGAISETGQSRNPIRSLPVQCPVRTSAPGCKRYVQSALYQETHQPVGVSWLPQSPLKKKKKILLQFPNFQKKQHNQSLLRRKEMSVLYVPIDILAILKISMDSSTFKCHADNPPIMSS